MFETNSSHSFIPASNAKLLTTALALDQLGSMFQVTTRLETTALPDTNGIVAGNLVVVGGGDPSFATTWHPGNWEAAFTPLTDQIAHAGIRQVDGDLVVDDSRFRGPLVGKGWDPDDLHYSYGARASALTVQDNLAEFQLRPGQKANDPASIHWEPVDGFTQAAARSAIAFNFSNAVTTGPTNGTTQVWIDWRPDGHGVSFRGSLPRGGTGYIADLPLPAPAAAFGGYLLESIARHGIRVSGKVRTAGSGDPTGKPLPAERFPLGEIHSPPLNQWMAPTLKNSQNLYAQLMLLDLGAWVEDQEAFATNGPIRLETTAESALSRLNGFLKRAGISPDDVRLEEGSGLSRQDSATPRSLVQLLLWMRDQTNSPVWREALPIGGVDGTLRNRFLRPPTRGQVRAKTGSLTGVSTLSGYLTLTSGEDIVFSILVNRWTTAGAAQCRLEIDRLVETVAAFNGPLP